MAPRKRKGAATEVDAYIFIKRKLGELGWVARNPERNPDGQVWTQNECLSNPRIKECLGADKPENIVKVRETSLWVIEAKRSQKELARAVKEARGYAAKINNGSFYDALLVSGVAGNDEDGFIVQTELLRSDGEWRTVQNQWNRHDRSPFT